MAYSLVVIGSGSWGQRHIETIMNAQELSLAGVVSRSLSKSPRPLFRNIQPRRVWHDIEEMLRSGVHADGVVLAVPPTKMSEAATLLIDAGIPVFVEKPLTLSAAEAVILTEKAIRANVLLMVNFIHLFSPGYQRLRTKLPALGTLQRVLGCGGNTGPIRNYMNALWDYGPHELAFAFDLLGYDPNELTARLVCGGRNEHVVEVTLNYPESIAKLRFGNRMHGKHRLLTCIGSCGELKLNDHPTPVLTHSGKLIPIIGPPPLEAALYTYVLGIKNSYDPLDTAALAVRVNQCLKYIDEQLCVLPDKG